jgi:3-hydroxyacyl-[acyl-carrier-protein] dehydratase
VADVTGVAGITRIIPHRYPVLLVDRVSDVVAGERLTGHKAVTAAERCYRDVRDGDYAYPFGLLLESWAQSAVVLTQWDRPNPDVLAGKAVLISNIRAVDVFGAVYPGDVLEHRVRIVRALDDAAILTGETLVAGRRVLSVGQFTLALRDVEVLGGSHVN